MKARLTATGQSCIGPKRVIVSSQQTCNQFTSALISELQTKKFNADYSILVHAGAKQEVARKVQLAVEHGCNILFGDIDGGQMPAKQSDHLNSAYYNPVVLSNMTPENPMFDQEIFGPVISIIQAEGEKEAVALANRSSFGLGGAVFSRDEDRALKIAETEMQSGMCFVNEFCRSDPSLPFGGVKNSGIGRECGPHGMLEWTNVKTVCVA